MAITYSSDQKKVLVVDDDPFVRSVMSMALSSEGFNVVEAATGQEAIDVLREDKPHVVLLDPGLPDMDGFEISRLIRDEKTMAGVHVIVVSGSTGIMNKLSGFLSGARAFIGKPFQIEDLISKVELLS